MLLRSESADRTLNECFDQFHLSAQQSKYDNEIKIWKHWLNKKNEILIQILIQNLQFFGSGIRSSRST